MKESKVVKSACGLCLSCCGINIHVEDGRIVKVTGMQEHPINRGKLCPRGACGHEWVCSPNRLQYPMKRKNGDWMRISWDEALDIIAQKLTAAKQKHGARTIASVMGMSILTETFFTQGVASRFFDVFGVPNRFDVDSFCYRGRVIGFGVTMGKVYYQDLLNTKCILLWAQGVENSFRGQHYQIEEARRNGAKLMVMDPRSTYWAKRADLYVRPRPGSDCALALGLLNVIITEGLYDQDFVKNWTVGFDKLAGHVKAYPPEKVETITWVPAQAIREIARTFATTKPACIQQGAFSLDRHAAGVQNHRAIAILHAITNNLDVSGGLSSLSQIPMNSIRLPHRLEEEPMGIDKFPLFYMFSEPYGDAHASLLWDAILAGKPYPIKTLLISGANPVLTFFNSRVVTEALSKLEFLVVIDHFMSETAKFAHLVLPAASFMERIDFVDFYHYAGLSPYVMLRKKAVQFGECWSDRKFWIELAKKMGYEKDFPWQNDEEVIDYIIEPSGLTVKKLTEEYPEGLTYGSWEYGAYKKTGFRTPSGKFEIYSEIFAKHGYEPLPTHRELPESHINSPELAKEYPLLLMHGARQRGFLASRGHDIPTLLKLMPEALAEIHPDTATKYGLKDGDMALVATKTGSIEIRVNVTEDIVPGVVSIPHGWANANVNLLTDYTPVEPISGHPAGTLLCKIRRTP